MDQDGSEVVLRAVRRRVARRGAQRVSQVQLSRECKLGGHLLARPGALVIHKALQVQAEHGGRGAQPRGALGLAARALAVGCVADIHVVSLQLFL